MDPPHLIVFVALDPKTRADQEKLAQGLRALMTEDPAIRVNTDTQTGRTIIRGTDELHLKVVVDRLTREFGVAAYVSTPQVSYRETIRTSSEAEGRYVQQTSEPGHFGHVKLRMKPLPPGSGFVFENQITTGAIPKEFINAVEAGIAESLEGGVLAGYPMTDLKVSLYDGSFHEVDSSGNAFRIAGSMAAKEAARKAKPVLLEPIMAVEVVVPEEYLGDVINDINRRRGRIEEMELIAATQLIRSSVPLSEMFGYAADLRSRTQGRASYTMRFNRYEPLTRGPDSDDEDRGAPVPVPRTPAPKEWHSAIQRKKA